MEDNKPSGSGQNWAHQKVARLPSSSEDSDAEDPPRKRNKQQRTNQKVLILMNSEGTRDFLRRIFSNETPCSRQAEWDRATTGDELVVQGNFGAILDEEQVEKAAELLSIFYQDLDPNASQRTVFGYVISVFLPEALKHVLCTHYGYSDAQAEQQICSETVVPQIELTGPPDIEGPFGPKDYPPFKKGVVLLKKLPLEPELNGEESPQTRRPRRLRRPHTRPLP